MLVGIIFKIFILIFIQTNYTAGFIGKKLDQNCHLHLCLDHANPGIIQITKKDKI